MKSQARVVVIHGDNRYTAYKGKIKWDEAQFNDALTPEEIEQLRAEPGKFLKGFDADAVEEPQEPIEPQSA